jgi:hypothetical protein
MPYVRTSQRPSSALARLADRNAAWLGRLTDSGGLHASSSDLGGGAAGGAARGTRDGGS